MTGAGHTLSGLIAGIPLAYLTYQYGGGFTGSLTCLSMCTLGATAPDWLEIPYSVKRKRNGKSEVIYKRLLKHRGVTHILTVWTGLFLWSFMYLKNGSDVLGFIDIPAISIPILFGFFAGGLLHLIGDIPNKTKIPIFTTYDGIALNLWKSGEYERLTGTLLLGATIAFTYYESNIYSALINII